MHECAEAHLNESRIDQLTPATTILKSDTQQVDQYNSVTVEEDSEPLSSEENPYAQMKALLKGKAKVATDFQVQTQKSTNKPSQKKRKVMRNRNAGISINEPPDDSQFLSPPIQKKI